MAGLEKALQRWFRRAVQIRIGRDALLVRDARTGAEIHEPPLIAVTADGKRRWIVATGKEAASRRSQPGVSVVNPFVHPRSPFGDFTLAEQVIRSFLKRLPSGGFFAPSPAVVIGLDGEEPEGGLTQIEIRVMKELALGAGASDVKVWQGPRLTDAQVLELDFPPTGRVLD